MSYVGTLRFRGFGEVGTADDLEAIVDAGRREFEANADKFLNDMNSSLVLRTFAPDYIAGVRGIADNIKVIFNLRLPGIIAQVKAGNTAKKDTIIKLIRDANNALRTQYNDAASDWAGLGAINRLVLTIMAGLDGVTRRVGNLVLETARAAAEGAGDIIKEFPLGSLALVGIGVGGLALLYLLKK